MPKRYQIRKTEVQAEQLTVQNASALATWCGGRVVEEIDAFDNTPFVGINYVDSSGTMGRISENEWLIRNNNGKFHKVSDSQFQEAFKEI